MNRKVARYSQIQLAQRFYGIATGALLATGAALTGCGGTDPQPPSMTGGNTSVAGNPGTGGASGGGGSTGSGGTTSQAGNAAVGLLLPFAVGDTWTYKVTSGDGSTATTKVNTVLAMEPVGGPGVNKDLMAFKVETRKGDNSSDKTESWQLPLAENPQRVVRFRELSYGASGTTVELEEDWEPHKIHIDGSPDKIAAGEWSETYTEHKRPVGGAVATGTRYDLWTVLGADTSVVANGKTYEHAVHFRKSGSSEANSTKEYWYVRGVGKVKESGGGQVEELVSYKVGGVSGP